MAGIGSRGDQRDTCTYINVHLRVERRVVANDGHNICKGINVRQSLMIHSKNIQAPIHLKRERVRLIKPRQQRRHMILYRYCMYGTTTSVSTRGRNQITVICNPQTGGILSSGVPDVRQSRSAVVGCGNVDHSLLASRSGPQTAKSKRLLEIIQNSTL